MNRLIKALVWLGYIKPPKARPVSAPLAETIPTEWVKPEPDYRKNERNSAIREEQLGQIETGEDITQLLPQRTVVPVLATARDHPPVRVPTPAPLAARDRYIARRAREAKVVDLSNLTPCEIGKLIG